MTIKRKEEIIRRRMEAERKALIEKVLLQKLTLLQGELGVHVDELRKEFDIAE